MICFSCFYRRLQRQRTNGSPDARMHSSTMTTGSSTTAVPGAGNSNSLPSHQSVRTKHNYLDQQIVNSSENLHGEHDSSHSPPSSLLRKKNLSTSDLDPIERKKQAALVKVEAKLEKARTLHQKAHQSVEQEISDFLRITTLPNANQEASVLKSTNAAFEKRIRTLQDTKKELEKKITGYQADITRINAGDIPTNYTSSKDLFSNLKSTAAKVAGGSLKYRSVGGGSTELAITHPNETTTNHLSTETDHHFPSNTMNSSGATNNNNQTLHVHSNQVEVTHPSPTSSLSNEIGNSQFYIDSTHEHLYDGEKINRKHDGSIATEALNTLENDRSPSSKRRLTDETNYDSNDRISDHSTDDRISKRNPSIAEIHQLTVKIDAMQKMIDRYDFRCNDMQKQIETLQSANEHQRAMNDRLNNEITDLIDLHQIEMSSIKTDLKTLEDRLAYKFADYWSEVLEKLEKLDTRTAKVEQTQTHSLETEENTHRIISKLVNILLTVFAIILLLLSTIKNLVQSRVHALTLLVLVLVWIMFHYLPPNYFQTSVVKNFPNMFKRTS